MKNKRNGKTRKTGRLIVRSNPPKPKPVFKK